MAPIVLLMFVYPASYISCNMWTGIVMYPNKWYLHWVRVDQEFPPHIVQQKNSTNIRSVLSPLNHHSTASITENFQTTFNPSYLHTLTLLEFGYHSSRGSFENKIRPTDLLTSKASAWFMFKYWHLKRRIILKSSSRNLFQMVIWLTCMLSVSRTSLFICGTVIMKWGIAIRTMKRSWTRELKDKRY